MNYLHFKEALRQFDCTFEITTSNKLIWHGQNPPTQEQVNTAIEAAPMRRLREERNQKLTNTDWWCCSDRTPTKAQLDYRKSLRDLTSTAKPKLDENGQLTGVIWPTKPE